MVKIFSQEFDKLLKLVSSNEPFCFTRFSDGEVTILRNKTVVLGDGYFIQGDLHGDQRNIVHPNSYNKEEQKEFYPEKHFFFHKRLVEAFKYKKHNYFKGIPPQNALDGDRSWRFCIDLYGPDDHDHLSFSNVMINDNYKRFIYEMVPTFCNKKIVLVSNENSKIDNLPFKVIKHYKIGSNCMVNNYYLIDEIKDWINENKIENTLFLFSASTLSNLLGYELYKSFDQNQYLDIGSSLGPLLGLQGWRATRTYLNIFWSNPSNPSPQEVDIWN
jgi:hypothetical protein